MMNGRHNMRMHLTVVAGAAPDVEYDAARHARR